MTSIDEAIAHAREIAEEQRKDNENCKYKAEYGCKGCADYYSKPCIECAEEHERLAEWLEELKAYREIGTVEECKGCVLEILEAYNKAIDDFEQKILEKAPKNYAGDLELGGSVSFLSANAVTKIAEQLKVGGKNE